MLLTGFVFVSWLGWVSVAPHMGFSLVAASAGWLLSSCSAQASHCRGFLLWGHWFQGAQASVVGAQGLSSCSSWALDWGLSIWGALAQLLHSM